VREQAAVAAATAAVAAATAAVETVSGTAAAAMEDQRQQIAHVDLFLSVYLSVLMYLSVYLYRSFIISPSLSLSRVSHCGSMHAIFGSQSVLQ
jgi:hypothetical protein